MRAGSFSIRSISKAAAAPSPAPAVPGGAIPIPDFFAAPPPHAIGSVHDIVNAFSLPPFRPPPAASSLAATAAADAPTPASGNTNSTRALAASLPSAILGNGNGVSSSEHAPSPLSSVVGPPIAAAKASAFLTIRTTPRSVWNLPSLPPASAVGQTVLEPIQEVATQQKPATTTKTVNEAATVPPADHGVAHKRKHKLCMNLFSIQVGRTIQLLSMVRGSATKLRLMLINLMQAYTATHMLSPWLIKPIGKA
jgi:hypothetical protein